MTNKRRVKLLAWCIHIRIQVLLNLNIKWIIPETSKICLFVWHLFVLSPKKNTTLADIFALTRLYLSAMCFTKWPPVAASSDNPWHHCLSGSVCDCCQLKGYIFLCQSCENRTVFLCCCRLVIKTGQHMPLREIQTWEIWGDFRELLNKDCFCIIFYWDHLNCLWTSLFIVILSLNFRYTFTYIFYRETALCI